MPRNSDCNFDKLIYPEANSDVSGTGVLIGSLAPMYMALVITTLYYILGYNPMVSHRRKEDDPIQFDHKPNPVDLFLFRLFRLGQSQVAPTTPDDTGRQAAPVGVGGHVTQTASAASDSDEQLQVNGKIAKAFGKCILSLADIQLFTGLAILISGYANLYQGISIYHWQILVLLAWCANVTHLCALTFLRNHFYQKQGQRATRLVLMTVLLVLLVVALIPTADFAMGPKTSFDDEDNWYGGGEHAVCLFGSMNKWRSLDTMIPSFLMLVYSSAIRAFKLFPEFTQNQGKSMRSSISRACQRKLKLVIEKFPPNKSARASMIESLLTSCFVVARFYFDLYISMAAEVYFLYFSVAWGTYRLLHIKLWDGPDGEHLWDFGQVVPVVLLLSPIFALGDSFSDLGRVWADFSVRDSLRTVQTGICRLWRNIVSGRSIIHNESFHHTNQDSNQQQLLDQEDVLQLLRQHTTEPFWYGYLVTLGIICSFFACIQVFYHFKGNVTKAMISMITNVILLQPMTLTIFVWANYLAEIHTWGKWTIVVAFVWAFFSVTAPLILGLGSFSVFSYIPLLAPFMFYILYRLFITLARKLLYAFLACCESRHI